MRRIQRSTAAIIAGTLALLLLAGLLGGCTWERGSGDITTDEREVSGFERIELRGTGRLEIVQGATEGVSVTIDDNLQPLITTEVIDDTLVISAVSRRNGLWLTVWPSEDPVYRVEVKDLSRVAVSGSGSIRADELDVQDLEVTISGSGDLKINDLSVDTFEFHVSGSGEADVAGQADEIRIEVSGSGKIDAKDLEADRADVTISGSGDAIVWVTDDLEVDVSGSGSVDYYGSPSVDQNVSGSGSVDSRGDK